MELVRRMKTVFDVQQLLKRFGTYVYLGDRMAELELMELELNELYRAGLLETEEFARAMAVLFQAKKEEKQKNR